MTADSGALTEEKLRGPPFMPAAPHVVLLGAGASRAGFPEGDRNRKLVPLMDGLPDILGKPWCDLVERARPPHVGFEMQFSWIRKSGGYADELREIERLIDVYFDGLDLPDSPTIYDYLVLGLRPKDIIATFNWDPFLMLAERRNRYVAPLPDIRFLHGCVRYATCPKHDVLGTSAEMCPECRTPLTRSRLLLPDDQKDYTRDPQIQRDWNIVTEKLKKAFHLTIFGYSGPATDFKARQLLLEGWRQTPIRDISHVEIIDIRDEDELREGWGDFIPFGHDMVRSTFWESTIARWPRRTAEYKLSASLYGIPSKNVGPLRTESLEELQTWHAAIAAAEPKQEPI